MKVLKEIDNYLNSKSKKEVFYVYVLIALVIGFVMIYFLLPKAQDYAKTQKQTNEKLINQKNALISQKRVFETRITMLRKEIKKLDVQKKQLAKKKAFFEQLVSLLDFANFNKKKWAKLVKSSVDIAGSEGMKVVKITNNIYDDNQTKIDKKLQQNNVLVKRMDMDVYLLGDYKNFIYYMYDFENRKELIRVNEFRVESPTQYYLKISVYGFVK